MIDRSAIREAAGQLALAPSLLLLTHTHPDGDTVGSAIALRLAMPEKEIYIVTDGALPASLTFLTEQFGVSLCTAAELPSDFTPALTVALDVASRRMLGENEGLADRVDLCIDHHGTGEDFARCTLRDPQAAACAELLCEVLSEMGCLNAQSASALYVGLATDTGCFRYQNVTPATLRCAATLLEAGVPAATLNHRLFESKTPQELAAVRCALNEVRLLFDGQVAMVTLTEELRERYGFDAADAGIISAQLKEIAGIKLNILLRCETEGSYKVSMRSTEEVDVAALCASLGGGGHLRAAGATVQAASILAAEQMVLQAVAEVL